MNKFLKTTVLLLMCAGVQSAGAVTLEECYSLVKQNYPQIRQYDLARSLEQYSFANASAAYLPQVILSGQATYQSAVSEFPEQMNQLYQAAGINMEGLTRDQYKLMLQVTQTIWDGGASSARKASAEADTKVSLLSTEKDIEALEGRVNQIYFGILVLEENLATVESMQELLEQNRKAVQSGVDNGAVLKSDLDKIRVEMLSLDQKKLDIEKSIDVYRKVLSIMTGRQITDSLEIPAIPYVDRNLNQRLELSLFDAQSAQAEAQKRLVNASVKPQFDLFAQGWYGKPGLNLFEDMMNNRFTWNYIAGVRMQWNISSFYTRRNNLRAADARSEMARTQKQTFEWEMSLQQLQMENEIDKMQELQARDDEIIALRRSIREASESQYRNGVITVSELLRDITEENTAVQTGNIHYLDMLRNLYDLKVTLNQ